jgi:hypothetical protein
MSQVFIRHTLLDTYAKQATGRLKSCWVISSAMLSAAARGCTLGQLQQQPITEEMATDPYRVLSTHASHQGIHHVSLHTTPYPYGSLFEHCMICAQLLFIY